MAQRFGLAAQRGPMRVNRIGASAQTQAASTAKTATPDLKVVFNMLPSNCYDLLSH
jgi:hypothetical protein